jgi:hypothetical protein
MRTRTRPGWISAALRTGGCLLLLAAASATGQDITPESPYAGVVTAFHDPVTHAKTPLAATFDDGLELARQEHRRVGGDLARWRARMRAYLPAGKTTDGGLIRITAVAHRDTAGLAAELRRLGAQRVATYSRIISAWIPAAALDALSASTTLRFARVSYSARSAGLVTSQGDTALRGASARATGGYGGSGITVGVLSDSYDCLHGASTDTASNDLPAGIQVLEDAATLPTGCAGLIDEGRAMLQIVHDLAPGAGGAFYTGEGGVADYANGIRALAATAHARVIVDDLAYYDEPMFQDGPIAQAIDAVYGQGVAYYSAAGNFASQSYQSAFVNSNVRDRAIGGFRHNFATTGTVTLQPVAIPVGGTIIISLQWDQPFFSVSGGSGAANNVDFVIYDGAGSTAVAAATANSIGGDAVKAFSWRNPGPATNYNFAIVWNGGATAPGLVKYVYSGPLTVNNFATNSSTLWGHSNGASARAVAAAYYGNTPAYGVSPAVLESYSALGGTPILFDTTGNRLATPLVRAKPEFTSVDGVDTTFFGSDTDKSGYPNFYGTSAAAPHAAAIAALLAQAQPSATGAQIDAAIQDTTLSMGASPFDTRSGVGLVQADAALNAISGITAGTYVGFSSLPNGTPVNGSFAANAYALDGLASVAVTGRSDGRVGVGPGPSTASSSGFGGATILATGSAGNTAVTLTFSPAVTAVRFAFASSSGSADIQVLNPSGVQVLRTTLTGGEPLSFAGVARLAGSAVVQRVGAIGKVLVRAVGGDMDLRISAVAINGSATIAGPANSGATVPLPPWAGATLGGFLLGLGALRLSHRRS